jgi:transposase
MEARTHREVWVDGKRKRSVLFIDLLKKLNRLYMDEKVIHILNNYVIHTSRITRKSMEKYNSRIVLHFLPPYCPDNNKIERGIWRELHTNMTRNYRCRNMAELLHEVRCYLVKRNRAANVARKRKAA